MNLLNLFSTVECCCPVIPFCRFFDLLKASMLLFFSTVEFTRKIKICMIFMLIRWFWSFPFLKCFVFEIPPFFLLSFFFFDVVMCMFCSEFILIWRSRQVGIKFGVVKTIYITSLAKKH